MLDVVFVKGLLSLYKQATRYFCFGVEIIIWINLDKAGACEEGQDKFYKGDCVMLRILFGEAAKAVYHPPTYFDNRYEEYVQEALSIRERL